MAHATGRISLSLTADSLFGHYGSKIADTIPATEGVSPQPIRLYTRVRSRNRTDAKCIDLIATTLHCGIMDQLPGLDVSGDLSETGFRCGWT
jgi:hypothetical protein